MDSELTHAAVCGSAEAEEEEALVKALVANEVMEDMLADTALEVAIVLSERRELWARAADAAAAAAQ